MDYIANSRTNAIENNQTIYPEKPASFYISNQFAKLFNSYTQTFNKEQNRTGSLFEHPFRRIPVTNEAYFTHLIHYIHTNPQKHNIQEDYTDYAFSSYSAHLLKNRTELKRDEVINWFGNQEQYVNFHQNYKDSACISSLIMD